jgi:hypothetical protein
MELLTAIFATVALIGLGYWLTMISDPAVSARMLANRDRSFRPARPLGATVPARASDPATARVFWAPATDTPVAVQFPTLSALDAARDPDQPRFATDPHAAYLEHCARGLVDRFWSETVWMTGLIDQSRLDTVCAVLERERSRRLDRIDILVMPESPRVTP